MITPGQCRAARALAEVEIGTLALKASVAAADIVEYEKMRRQPDPDNLAAIRRALEDLGAVFIPEDGMGVGVRLKFSRRGARRIGTWESEGGSVAEDDVP
ncbi:XRE family transcriptional regulator [Microvirga brassicacearum]|uniref:XRE family transcriptional regulator n=1 Tax=Microvirga brassicacearum TaxID=2580413 RepID=A0A5N3P784_9HYPH|nr:XRE family transcriptional regulator [Microvirga brassicacearum]